MRLTLPRSTAISATPSPSVARRNLVPGKARLAAATYIPKCRRPTPLEVIRFPEGWGAEVQGPAAGRIRRSACNLNTRMLALILLLDSVERWLFRPIGAVL